MHVPYHGSACKPAWITRSDMVAMGGARHAGMADNILVYTAGEAMNAETLNYFGVGMVIYAVAPGDFKMKTESPEGNPSVDAMHTRRYKGIEYGTWEYNAATAASLASTGDSMENTIERITTDSEHTTVMIAAMIDGDRYSPTLARTLTALVLMQTRLS